MHSTHPSAGDMRLGPAQPTLYVSDVAATCAFFADKLGFATVFTYGEPPFYGQVRRGDARINLRGTELPVFVGDVREQRDLHATDIEVADVDGLYAEFQARGAPVFQTLCLHPWGVRDFVVRDPDGNLIAFGHNPNPPG